MNEAKTKKEKEKETVKNLLFRLAANHTERKYLATLAAKEGVQICTGPDRVQLFRCIRRIAGLLGIPVKEEIDRYADGEKERRLSFVFEGVEFFELEEIKKEE
ncbi:MAG: hypothetical protein NC123_15580 [Butyrivibrio sp.]|nr:hypothetical protein [Acetatifactor muris]MCM1560940.1 hypothetical protein [Butyrivibrio sp.]